MVQGWSIEGLDFGLECVVMLGKDGLACGGQEHAAEWSSLRVVDRGWDVDIVNGP